ncbi:hypothetical protein QBC37DRAFT_419103 [Rhypophila decipiens]|uniref:Uncharacterized protein n=1 Tax=Rhypophila decipiens TaxID=261697 RepID=A0AAN6YF79_9PEZI|nr:hypothetical protein QBC37DRAFT_419103 [Rhypophila decipiens]
MNQPKLHLHNDPPTHSSVHGPSQVKASSFMPDDESGIEWNPYNCRLSLNFGTVGPSEGPWPWVLERKRAWDLNHWLSPSGGGGIDLVKKSKTVRLVLCEEFLFDTIDPNDTITFKSYISAAHAHRSLTPWDEILATLRWSFQSLKKRVELVEIHVQGLGSLSSMSDCGVGQEQNSAAVLRPTAGVYSDFMNEFTRFGPGTIGEVRLSGLFPGDWAALIEQRMPGTRVTKELSHFASEIRWWTADSDRALDLEGQPESEVRRRHAEARWVMLNGAGSHDDDCDSDPGYESDVCLDVRT